MSTISSNQVPLTLINSISNRWAIIRRSSSATRCILGKLIYRVLRMGILGIRSIRSQWVSRIVTRVWKEVNRRVSRILPWAHRKSMEGMGNRIVSSIVLLKGLLIRTLTAENSKYSETKYTIMLSSAF